MSTEIVFAVKFKEGAKPNIHFRHGGEKGAKELTTSLRLISQHIKNCLRQNPFAKIKDDHGIVDINDNHIFFPIMGEELVGKMTLDFHSNFLSLSQSLINYLSDYLPNRINGRSLPSNIDKIIIAFISNGENVAFQGLAPYFVFEEINDVGFDPNAV